MSVVWIEKSFSRVGRKTEGEAEAKYVAKQLANGGVDENNQPIPESISAESLSAFGADALEVCEGDMNKVREYFITGANHHLRLEAGGYTPEEKAAKALIKSGLPAFSGKTVEEVVAILNGLKK